MTTKAIRRMLLFLMNNWDGLEDGDGETVNLEEIATKTDFFLLIVGCWHAACDCIKDFNNLMKGVING